MMISRENMRERASMYRLLSRFFSREADVEFLRSLQNMSFPKVGGLLGDAYKLLSDYLAAMDENTLESLAVDYAGALLAAGSADGAAAIPVESLYGSNRSFAGDSWEDVRTFYARYGLGKTHEDMMEDHLALELEFMAYLCENGDAAVQKEFLEKHLLSWLPALVSDIEKHAKTDFYKAAGKMTLGYITMESEFLCAVEKGELLCSQSFSVRNERFANILARLKERYAVLAPIRREDNGTKKLVYGEINALTDIVHKEKAALCGKLPLSDERDLIIICRACDADSLRTLDGAKLVLLECRSTFDSCSCAAATCKAPYSAAMRIDDICALVEICDEELMPYFTDEVPIDFAPEFPWNNI